MLGQKTIKIEGHVFGENELIRTVTVMELLGVGRTTLWKWRQLKQGPPVVVIGRSVRYVAKDIQAFVNTGVDPATLQGGRN